MKSFFDLFKRRFTQWYRPDAMMKERLKSLTISDKTEISCDEVVEVLDQFADAIHRGENVLMFMPLVRQHLDVCPACREKYEALLKLSQPRFD